MRIPALLAATAALALPAAAAAKEVTALDVCGTDGCTRISDHASLRGFEQGGDLAEAAPSGLQRSYLLRVRMRDDAGGVGGWTNRWLPDAGLLVFRGEDGQLMFTRVEPVLERILRTAARGHEARPARHYTRSAPPVAQVAEVVAPPTTSARDDGGDSRAAGAASGAAALALATAAALTLRRRRSAGTIRARKA
jgi:hypothetical protein